MSELPPDPFAAADHRFERRFAARVLVGVFLTLLVVGLRLWLYGL
ncbi:hypothetical protein [Angustibacter luteus]|uniref:AI-2E family transporter n=1 Tax=Angustibacter luteus TaxID=658456 RepID=A0ABW1JI85_9ACTN